MLVYVLNLRERRGRTGVNHWQMSLLAWTVMGLAHSPGWQWKDTKLQVSKASSPIKLNIAIIVIKRAWSVSGDALGVNHVLTVAAVFKTDLTSGLTYVRFCMCSRNWAVNPNDFFPQESCVRYVNARSGEMAREIWWRKNQNLTDFKTLKMVFDQKDVPEEGSSRLYAKTLLSTHKTKLQYEIQRTKEQNALR